MFSNLSTGDLYHSWCKESIVTRWDEFRNSKEMTNPFMNSRPFSPCASSIAAIARDRSRFSADALDVVGRTRSNRCWRSGRFRRERGKAVEKFQWSDRGTTTQINHDIEFTSGFKMAESWLKPRQYTANMMTCIEQELNHFKVTCIVEWDLKLHYEIPKARP